MERIDNSNTQYTQKTEIVIGPREPYNKNTFWIKKRGQYFDMNLFNKGWETLSSTEDLGLSPKSKQQVEDMINEIKQLYLKSLEEFKGIQSLQSKKYLNKIKEQNEQIENLKKQLEDTNNKCNYLSLKLRNENRK